MMRWIKHTPKKVTRGETTPPTGDVHFVDDKGSKALVGGKLYIDGKQAGAGRYEIQVGTRKIPVTVEPNGKATRGV